MPRSLGTDNPTVLPEQPRQGQLALKRLQNHVRKVAKGEHAVISHEFEGVWRKQPLYPPDWIGQQNSYIFCYLVCQICWTRSTLPREPQKNLSPEDIETSYPTKLIFLPCFFRTTQFLNTQEGLKQVYFAGYSQTPPQHKGKSFSSALNHWQLNRTTFLILPTWTTVTTDTGTFNQPLQFHLPLCFFCWRITPVCSRSTSMHTNSPNFRGKKFKRSFETNYLKFKKI